MSEIKICDDLSYWRNQRAIEPLIAKSKFLLHPSRRMARKNLRHGEEIIFSSGCRSEILYCTKGYVLKKILQNKTTSLMCCYGQLERLDIRNVRSTLKTVSGSRLCRRFYGELFEFTGLKTRGYLTSRLPDD